MKSLSKTLIALFIGLLLFGNTDVKSQTTAENERHFRSGGWQLQNPENPYLSLILYFHKDENVVDFIAINLSTGQKGKIPCPYNIKGNQLTIYSDNGEDVFMIRWINKDKVILTEGTEKSIFVISGSPEDKFFSNLMNNNSNGYNYSVPQYSGQPVNNSKQTCVSCYGDGRCHVCGGSGIYSRYGNSHTCTACYGSGKCSICGGKGRY